MCAAMICIGLVPAVYVQIGTKYQKAGQVSMVSMCVVALATEVESVPGKKDPRTIMFWISRLTKN